MMTYQWEIVRYLYFIFQVYSRIFARIFRSVEQWGKLELKPNYFLFNQFYHFLILTIVIAYSDFLTCWFPFSNKRLVSTSALPVVRFDFERGFRSSQM